MTEYHVKQGAGGTGSTLPSLAAATKIARPGDIISLHEGIYREVPDLPAGITLRAADGEKAIFDGGWDGKPMKGAKANGILIKQPNITLQGLEIRNVRGRGVGLAQGDGFTMIGCYIHHTINGGFGANGTGKLIRNVNIEDCFMEHLSLSGRWQETPVNGCCLFRYVIGLRIKSLHIRYGHGEGFALGPFTQDAEVDGLLVEDTTHLGVYASNRAINVLFRNCAVIQRGLDEWRQGDGDVGGGFIIGDEVAGDKTKKWPNGDKITIENCITVNTTGVGVRNNVKLSDSGKLDGYDTRAEFVVQNCTFIAGPDSRSGIGIQENQSGGRVKGVFRNNLFILDRLPAKADAVKNNAPGVTFQNNGWSIPVPAEVRGDGNIQIDARAALVAPFAPLGETVDLSNYRARAGGAAAERGWGALPAVPDGPEPPDPEPEPEPEPQPRHEEFVIVRNMPAGSSIVVRVVRPQDIHPVEGGAIDWEATKHSSMTLYFPTVEPAAVGE